MKHLRASVWACHCGAMVASINGFDAAESVTTFFNIWAEGKKAR
jgi:hypothetical protein